MDIFGVVLFVLSTSILMYLFIKSEKKRRKQYFNDLNNCIYNALKSFEKDKHL